MDTIATVYSETFPTGDTSRIRCQLVVVEGPDEGIAIALSTTPVILGTSETAALRLTDPRVSGQHLEIQAVDHTFLVRDLGSSNGTLYEGSRITEAHVRPGATLKLGHTFVRIEPQARALDLAPSQKRTFGELVAQSLAMREVFAILELAATSDVTVLLEGETGTGKELAARALHDHGPRRKAPFVALDCGALPDALLESELFGHVPGAFTGAVGARQGAFVRAHGGTLLLDELSAVSREVQSRLLRVLEERRVRPVGADHEVDVDVRVIAAAGEGFENQVARGTLRPDLYYRLSVIHIHLPPLRRRREDIAPIAAAMLRRRGLEPGPMHGANLQRLYSHDWPGNVRELRNILERAIALSPRAESFEDLRVFLPGATGQNLTTQPAYVRSDLPFSQAKQLVLDDFERRYLTDLFSRCDGNISATARLANLDRKHARHLLRKHDLIDDPHD